MVLTNRDRELFRRLSNYGMFSTKQIAENIFAGIATTTVLRRLRSLEASHYIKRVTGLETQEILWVLTEKGADSAAVLIPKRNWSKNMLEHDHKLLSLRLILEKCGVAQSWIPEHEIRSLIFKKYKLKEAKQKLIPDGLMVIETNGKKLSLAIELELTLKNKNRLKEIVKRYQEKKDLAGVCYFARSKSILTSVFHEWNGQSDFNKSMKLYGFLFEDIMKDPLLVKERIIGLPAHSSAQRVSTLDSLILKQKIGITQENHLNKIEFAN